MKWLDWMKRGRQGRATGLVLPPSVLDREAFSRDLQRQRALCDRSGGQFVLMVFEVTGASSPPARRMHTERLCQIVARRIRVSDVAGQYSADARQIGVILPQTDAAGASRFVKAVEELMRRSLNGSWKAEMKLSCQVFAYPETLAAVALAASEAPERSPVKTR